MKTLVSLFISFTLITSSSAFSGYSSLSINANEIYLTVGKNLKISLINFSSIKINDYEKLTGRHLNLFQRIGFKSMQKKLKRSIEPDGTIKKGKFIKFLEGGPASGFHLGGFLLGFYLGVYLIGIAIAYILGGEPAIRKNRIKWMWIGLITSVIIGLVLIIIILSNLRIII